MPWLPCTPVVTFDGLNINDGTVYRVLVDVDLGNDYVTFDEYYSYSGAVSQLNISTQTLVTVRIPIFVQGTSFANLMTRIAAINTRIAGCGPAAPKPLIFDGVTYSIVASDYIDPVLDYWAHDTYACIVWLELNRLSGSTGTPGGEEVWVESEEEVTADTVLTASRAIYVP